jgi:hypothetical protein
VAPPARVYVRRDDLDSGRDHRWRAPGASRPLAVAQSDRPQSSYRPSRKLAMRLGWRVRPGAAETFSHRGRELLWPGRLLSGDRPAPGCHAARAPATGVLRGAIETVTATDPRVRRLRTVPTVGPVTAAAFVAAIDDATRFRGAHEVEAYLGLVPRELSSGETLRRGRITKAGHSRVRRLLVQAAVSRLRRPDPRTVPRSGPGPCGSRPGAERRWPSSRWPGAWPASSSRCCAMGPATSPESRAATPVPRLRR